jgi:hypothetical protein
VCSTKAIHDSFILVLSGIVTCISPELGAIGELKKSDTFGELPHMKAQPHTFEAVAKDNYTECMVISKKEAATLFVEGMDSENKDTIQFLKGNALFFNWSTR